MAGRAAPVYPMGGGERSPAQLAPRPLHLTLKLTLKVRSVSLGEGGLRANVVGLGTSNRYR